MYKVLLVLHIAAGYSALMAAILAVATRKGERWHVYAGRIFTAGMAVVFLTAVPMTAIKPNLFLLLIAVFSFYLALTGWMRARNRGSRPLLAEWIAAVVMALTSVAMGVRGAAMLGAGQSMGTVLLVFGGIGGVLAARDLSSLRDPRERATMRITAHVTRMLAGTIAAVTAFTVVNVRFEPAFVVWLAPTLVLTPLIVYWRLRIRRPAAATMAT